MLQRLRTLMGAAPDPLPALAGARIAALRDALGEPAGVGPEIVAAAWKALRADQTAFAVIGDDSACLDQTAIGKLMHPGLDRQPVDRRQPG